METYPTPFRPQELLGLDVLHKFMWVRLIARMFEAMAGNFAYSGDIHLLLNVLNGAVILHSEDACILRYVMATYINAAYNFRNIFCSNGYLMVIPTLLQLYSSHQTNTLVTRTVEYTVKQFYLMNRKPFILQMFGSVSAILDTDECGQYGDAHKVRLRSRTRMCRSRFCKTHSLFSEGAGKRPVQPAAESGDALARPPQHRRAGARGEAIEAHRLLLPRRGRDG